MPENDYLWDKSGKPDPDVERLEKLLGELGHKPGKVPEFPALVQPIRPSVMRRWLPRLAAAAVLVMALAGTAWYALRPKFAWDVETLAGTPTVGSKAIAAKGRLPLGEWLETDSESRAEISVDIIGTVQVEPNTRIGLVSAEATDHRLSLERGKIAARIWAPPGLFFVKTPSALAIDLGCKYTLEVDADGGGELHVSMGQVAYEMNGREAFVPEGAMCFTRPRIGPGTPHYEDASEKLRTALKKFDFELSGPEGGVQGGVPGGVPGGIPGGVAGGVEGGVRGGVEGGVAGGVEGAKKARAEALVTVLGESRKQDALSLWHLLSRVLEEERGGVYDKLNALVPAPTGVTREGILRKDRKMIEAWWIAVNPKHTSAEWYRWWKIKKD